MKNKYEVKSKEADKVILDLVDLVTDLCNWIAAQDREDITYDTTRKNHFAESRPAVFNARKYLDN